MSKVTRRGFLAKSSVSAAAVGALVAAPGIATASHASEASAAELSRDELAGPIMLQVRNLSTGEMAIMVGTREIVFRDRKLLARLVKAAR